MKSLSILIISFFTLLSLISCGEKTTTPEEENLNSTIVNNEVEREVIEEVIEFSSVSGETVTINNFTAGDTLKNGALLIGTIPVSWVVENNFPIKIMTLDGKILQEISAFAEAIDEEGTQATGDVQFVTEVLFENPEGVETGKIQFISANPQATKDDILEVNVAFEKTLPVVQEENSEEKTGDIE